MNLHRAVALAAAVVLLGGSAFVAAPAQAQNAPGGCTQNVAGAPVGGGNRSGRQNSAATLPSVIALAVQNVAVPIDVTALNNANVQVVCLNDVLNQNDVRVLQDILNESPILSGNNNNLNNILQNANILNNLALANGVQLVALNVGSPTASPTLFVLR